MDRRNLEQADAANDAGSGWSAIANIADAKDCPYPSAMYEFDPAPPTNTQRLVAVIIVTIVAVPAVNVWLDWGLFGGYDRAVSVTATFLGVIWFARFSPTVRKTDHDGS